MGVSFVDLDSVVDDPAVRIADIQFDVDAIYAPAYGAGGTYNAETLNKVWHTPTVQWVYWRTAAPDPSGVEYPGPGSYGDTTNYAVEGIVYVAV